jgi:hypothetical protein
MTDVLERVRDFFAGPEKRLFRPFFTFFHLHSPRYAHEKTHKTGEKSTFSVFGKKSRTRSYE